MGDGGHSRTGHRARSRAGNHGCAGRRRQAQTTARQPARAVAVRPAPQGPAGGLAGVAGRVQHRDPEPASGGSRSEEHTSELQSLMRISYAVFCLKKKTKNKYTTKKTQTHNNNTK